MKKSQMITMIVLLVVLLLAVAAGVTAYAVWQQEESNKLEFEMQFNDPNPSLNYQIFVPVNAEGERVSGSYDTTGQHGYHASNYVLAGGADAGSIVGLALVGWEGGISCTELNIPDEATLKINGVEQTLPVVSVRMDVQFDQNYFYGNEAIVNIVIGRNVTFIADGVFALMPKLTGVTVRGTEEDPAIEIMADAFSPFTPGEVISEGRTVNVGQSS